MTNGNKYLCQLLLSAVVLNYPTPVLVGWDSPEKGYSAKQYKAKVDAINGYLQSFKPSNDDDLVLIVAGFHTWFQLPPDLVIRRYFNAIKAENKRIRARLGSGVARKHDARQTILFSADKACGPQDEADWVGCWAPPQSPVPMYTFGPYNDTSFDDAKADPYHARPRWLNSGMMIGPARDMKILFEATSSLMESQTQGESDWWYYTYFYGLQEYSRARLESVQRLPPENIPPPQIKSGQQTEFHIGLDYESTIFQNLDYSDQYLTWWQYDGSKDMAISQKKAHQSLHHFKLSKDLLKSRRPFESMHDLKASAYNEKYQEILKKSGRPNFKMWEHLPLFTNVVTHQVFPMLHFSFEEDYRDIWWEKMWYYPFARDLVASSAGTSPKPIYKKRINGQMWYNSQIPESSYREGSNQERRDGAWTDKGEWKSFHGMCEPFEGALFGTFSDSSILNPT